jgi:hypothetical protein
MTASRAIFLIFVSDHTSKRHSGNESNRSFLAFRSFALLLEPFIHNELNLATEIAALRLGYPFDLGVDTCIELYRGCLGLLNRLLLALRHDSSFAFSASTSAWVRE